MKSSATWYSFFILSGLWLAAISLYLAYPFGYLNSWSNIPYALGAIPGLMLLIFGLGGLKRRRRLGNEKTLTRSAAITGSILILVLTLLAYILNVLLASTGS